MSVPQSEPDVSGALGDALLNDADEIILVVSEDMGLLKASLPARQVFGARLDRHGRHGIMDLLDPPSREIVAKLNGAMRLDGEVFSLRLGYIEYNGATAEYMTKIRYLRPSQGSHGFRLFFLGERNPKSKPRLSDVNVEYTLGRFLMGVSDSVLLIDFKKRAIVDCNAGAEFLFGYSREEIIGRSPQFLSASEADSIRQAKASFVAYEKAGFYQDRIVCKKKNGTLFLTLATNIAFFDSEKRLAYILAMNRDITESFDNIQAISRLSDQALGLLNRIAGIIEPMKMVDFRPSLTEMGYSKRRIQIISRIVSGEPTKAIAFSLKLSESSIKAHLTEIYKKVGVSSRVEFLKYVHDHHVKLE